MDGSYFMTQPSALYASAETYGMIQDGFPYVWPSPHLEIINYSFSTVHSMTSIRSCPILVLLLTALSSCAVHVDEVMGQLIFDGL
jgi:hypothetical protein